ncbi:MAG TPA: ADP-forming succinate--CoA ligase subunit beta [Armatimonadota bacterium]
MKLQEYQAKDILRDYGVPVPSGIVCRTPKQVREAAEQFGGAVVIKAQVLVGGRGKAGGVKVARSEDDAETLGGRILGMDIKGLTVTEVLVEPALDIADEIYVGIVTDRAARRNAVIVSAAGGVDIEQVADETPEKILKARIDPELGLRDYQARELAFGAGLRKEAVAALPKLLAALYRAYLDNDANLAEINPLVVTADGRVIAADAKMVIDDNATYRHPELSGAEEAATEDPLEAEAKRLGINYVRLGGDIGTIGNGAGLAMANLDEVKLVGGAPANFLDIGGGAKAEDVERCLGLILQDPNVKGVMINIFGGITRADEVAKGIVQAQKSLNIRLPLVVRLTGTNEEAGRAILAEADGLIPASSMADAARKIVNAVVSRQSSVVSPTT